MKKKNSVYMAIILAITLAFMFSVVSRGQNVKRIGSTFVEQVDSTTKSKRSEAKKTVYVYVDKHGVSYPVYISSANKAFIKKVSKKTGKEYKQYLPEVTKLLK